MYGHHILIHCTPHVQTPHSVSDTLYLTCTDSDTTYLYIVPDMYRHHILIWLDWSRKRCDILLDPRPGLPNPKFLNAWDLTCKIPNRPTWGQCLRRCIWLAIWGPASECTSLAPNARELQACKSTKVPHTVRPSQWIFSRLDQDGYTKYGILKLIVQADWSS
jgi:hypothetical protein